ncbi:MAG: glycosyltransferase family 2 protein [Bacteroidales bacterium]|jgi:glycosyltransferase involved in cell wall biosynthesis|nr:glycosyltransferase family 2 protein [Bacteroidales bacterium]
MLNITAIIAVRNETKYLPVTLAALACCDINFIIIDHGSTDDIDHILKQFHHNLIKNICIPYKGYFSLSDQIIEKNKIIESVNTDWLIHQDADEILESPEPGETLRDGIQRINEQGFTAMNFNEFVFIPTLSNSNHESGNFYHTMLHYYFYEPVQFRLNRAWKKNRNVYLSDGGHNLASKDLLLFPRDAFVLRHYICLSKEHIINKYKNRNFSKEDLDKGWHKKRLNFTDAFSFPDEFVLQKLPFAESKDFITVNPWKNHFWESFKT